MKQHPLQNKPKVSFFTTTVFKRQSRHCSWAASEDHRLTLCKCVTNRYAGSKAGISDCSSQVAQNWFILMRASSFIDLALWSFKLCRHFLFTNSLSITHYMKDDIQKGCSEYIYCLFISSGSLPWQRNPLSTSCSVFLLCCLLLRDTHKHSCQSSFISLVAVVRLSVLQTILAIRKTLLREFGLLICWLPGLKNKIKLIRCSLISLLFFKLVIFSCECNEQKQCFCNRFALIWIVLRLI